MAKYITPVIVAYSAEEIGFILRRSMCSSFAPTGDACRKSAANIATCSTHSTSCSSNAKANCLTSAGCFSQTQAECTSKGSYFNCTLGSDFQCTRGSV